MKEPRERCVRWWPVIVIAGLAGGAIAVVWGWPETQRQQRYLRTAGTLLFSGFFLLLWLLFFSRIRWRVRLATFAAVLVVVGGVASAFRIRGVNGDLLPILEPRWARRAPVAAGEPAAKRVESHSRTNFGEFVQFYGPNRNGVPPGPELETNWTENPPRVLWKQPIGAGWSGFAVKDGLAITMEQRGAEETVSCYEALTGKAVWNHSDRVIYSTTIAGEGPRTTPAISGDRVYTFGATGLLNCFDLQSGAVIWSKDAAKENESHVPDWGFSSSPLVVDGKVIINIGGRGTLAAYSGTDGKLLWCEGKAGIEYSSPIEVSLLGAEQILIFSRNVESHAPDGKLLWEYPWPGGHPHITPPLVVASNLVAISSGYGTGIELVKVARDEANKWSAERVWKSIALKSKFGPLFQVGEYIYGLDDGIFCCVELKTGQRRWKDGRYGHGQGLLIGKQVLLTTEKGELALVEPNPEKLSEVARFEVFSSKTWNPPALAGEYLFLRNDKEAACVQLKRKKRA